MASKARQAAATLSALPSTATLRPRKKVSCAERNTERGRVKRRTESFEHPSKRRSTARLTRRGPNCSSPRRQTPRGCMMRRNPDGRNAAQWTGRKPPAHCGVSCARWPRNAMCTFCASVMRCQAMRDSPASVAAHTAPEAEATATAVTDEYAELCDVGSQRLPL